MRKRVGGLDSSGRPEDVDYDVTIVGAGVVGATLGCALVGAGLRVAIVERARVGGGCADPRVSVITEGSRELLRRAGVYSLWSAAAPVRVRGVLLAEGDHGPKLNFTAARLGVNAVGYAFENRRLVRQLHTRIQSEQEVTVVSPATLCAAEESGNLVRVWASSSAESPSWTTRLLVGADGWNSKVRELAGISGRVRESGLCCIVFSMGFTHDHGGRCFELLQPSFALLPLGGGPSNPRPMQVVWTVKEAEAAELVKLDDDAFLRRVERRLGRCLGVLGEPRWVSVRAHFPVRRLRFAPCARGRIVLAGDAAHVVTPFCGQGLNMGIRDALVLAELILRHPSDPGFPKLCRHYARRRWLANAAISQAIDLGAWWCNQRSPALSWLRSAAMARIERSHLEYRILGRLAIGVPASPNHPKCPTSMLWGPDRQDEAKRHRTARSTPSSFL